MSNSKTTPLIHGISGAAAGAISCCTLHPLDLIKTRFQADMMTKSRSGRVATGMFRYRSTIHAFTSIMKNEGVTNLYRGLTPALMGNVSAWGFYFFMYNKSKQMIQNVLEDDTSSAAVNFVSAANAGISTQMMLNPVWLIKTRMQLQSKTKTPPEHLYKGFIDGIRKIIQHEGVTGLYTGLVPALWMVSHGAIQFMAYEEIVQLMHRIAVLRRPDGDLHAASFLLGGAAAKVTASTATYPLQVVKTRLQDQQNSGKEKRYKGMFDALIKILKNEGLRGIYRGVTINAVRTAPSAAIVFFSYEHISKSLDSLTSDIIT